MEANKYQTPFWLITFAVLTGLTLPVLIQDGMFLDAVYYSCISHNLSQGIGNFWFAVYNEEGRIGIKTFHEQPPLVFGIESFFFRLLGGSIYTERCYTFFTMLIAAWGIHKLWHEIFNTDARIAALSWLPILLWITMPVCFWSYRNNMCENTMAIFTLVAVWLLYRYTHTQSGWLLLLAALMIVAASMSKGPPGLFPIAFPFLATLFGNRLNVKQAVVSTMVLALMVVLAFVLILAVPEAKASLSIYFFERLIGRIGNEPTVASHFAILGYLAQELITASLLLLTAMIVKSKNTQTYNYKTNSSHAWLMIAVGLSGTLPLMLTLVQKPFYMVAALPFFAIGMAIWLAPIVLKVIVIYFSSIKAQRNLRWIGIVGIVFSLVLTTAMCGRASRDKEVLQETHTIGNIIGKHQRVTASEDLYNDLLLLNYLMRNYNIDLVHSDSLTYYISTKGSSEFSGAAYQKVPTSLLHYELYKRR